MSVSVQTTGPALFTSDAIGDWGGHEDEVCDELNQLLGDIAYERHGLTHAGSGIWYVTLTHYPDGPQVDGKPDFDGRYLMDWDDITECPERYLSAQLLRQVMD